MNGSRQDTSSMLRYRSTRADHNNEARTIPATRVTPATPLHLSDAVRQNAVQGDICREKERETRIAREANRKSNTEVEQKHNA